MDVLSKLCRLCKGIDAAYLIGPLRETLIYPIIILLCRYKTLDLYVKAAYINKHSHHPNPHFGHTQLQTRSPRTSRNAQPSPRARACPALPDRQLLRPRRSRAGQVRDAATGHPRGCKQGRGGPDVWDIAPHVLSGRSRVRPSGDPRVAATPTRTKGRPQAEHRGHGLHRGVPHRRSHFACARACPGYPERARSHGASPQYRARIGTEKKTPAPRAPVILPPDALDTYERLRAEVLQGRARPEGLGVIVYHGLLQGLSVILRSPPTPSPQPATISPKPAVGPHDPQLIGLLTNMLLHVHSEVRHVI